MNDLHLKIKEARTSSVYKTQKALAEQLNVSPGAISQWESEDPAMRTVPDLKKLVALAEATGKPIGWFFGEDPAKAERKRIVDMLLDMHAQEERHNYFLFISNIIKESA